MGVIIIVTDKEHTQTQNNETKYYVYPRRWYRSNYIRNIYIHQNEIEIELMKPTNALTRLTLIRDLRIFAEMNNAWAILKQGTKVLCRITLSNKRYRIYVPKDTTKIILKAKPWLKHIFTKKYRMINWIYEGTYINIDPLIKFLQQYEHPSYIQKLSIISIIAKTPRSL